jgi:hypothetical protein
MFGLSGGYHLLHLGIRGDAGERIRLPLKLYHTADLRIVPEEAVKRSDLTEVESVSLAHIGGQTYYRVQPAPTAAVTSAAAAHHHGTHVPHGKVTPGQVAVPRAPVFVSTVNGSVLTDGLSRFAIEIAEGAVSRPSLGEVTPITQFDGEYGFAFKRLPVLRVPFGGDVTAYVDPADGSIAAIVDDSDRAEGWVFGYVHKLDWLVQFVGTDGRDGIAALLALGLAIAALLGITLYWKLARGGRRITGKPRQP